MVITVEWNVEWELAKIIYAGTDAIEALTSIAREQAITDFFHIGYWDSGIMHSIEKFKYEDSISIGNYSTIKTSDENILVDIQTCGYPLISCARNDPDAVYLVKGDGSVERLEVNLIKLEKKFRHMRQERSYVNPFDLLRLSKECGALISEFMWTNLCKSIRECDINYQFPSSEEINSLVFKDPIRIGIPEEDVTSNYF